MKLDARVDTEVFRVLRERALKWTTSNPDEAEPTGLSPLKLSHCFDQEQGILLSIKAANGQKLDLSIPIEIGRSLRHLMISYERHGHLQHRSGMPAIALRYF